MKLSHEQKAVEEYLGRQNRTIHPDGKTDSAGRWYPSDSEEKDCCSYIRRPTRSYPYSLLTHCRSLEHIANLYNVNIEKLKQYPLLCKVKNKLYSNKCKNCKHKYFCSTNI